jgi:hypothetical protein
MEHGDPKSVREHLLADFSLRPRVKNSRQNKGCRGRRS